MKVEIIEEDASELLVAMAGAEPGETVEFEEVEITMPSSSTPAVSGELSPSQGSGETGQQR